MEYNEMREPEMDENQKFALLDATLNLDSTADLGRTGAPVTMIDPSGRTVSVAASRVRSREAAGYKRK